MSAISFRLIFELFSGKHQLGVRWKTVRCPTFLAIVWIVCTAVAPVPMMPTRLPAMSMPSFGQRWVWQDMPAKLSIPGMLFGITAAERTPTAVTRNRAE